MALEKQGTLVKTSDGREYVYPAHRKKANRTKESYRCKKAGGKKQYRKNLAMGRGLRKKYKPEVVDTQIAVDAEPKDISWRIKKTHKLSKAEIQAMDIIEFSTECLGISFKERPAQEVILRSLYGLPLDNEQLEIYKVMTGNEAEFEAGQEKFEAVLILGARGGKSYLSSICALYEATARADRWRKYLNPGEVGYIVIVATRQIQSQQIIGANCARMLENSRIAHLCGDVIATEISLTNGINIISMPCNSTAGRGLPICCLIFDEIGWYKIEGVRQDEEIFNALRPRQSQFRGAKVFAISTPAAKQGLFWKLFDEGMQVPNRLTVQATSIFMNPTIDEKFLESEKRRNPDNYAREFLAEFAESVDAFFPADKLGACFTLVGDVAPDSQYRYFCATDQSGLAGRDRFAMSIAHSEGKKTIVDCSRTWSTKDGDAIIAEIRGITRPYGINSVTIDRYAGGWVKNAFERQGFEVEVRDLLPPIFVNMKSLVIAGRVSLPDTKGLREGLLRTQAFYGRSNQLSIGHERSVEGHADEADSAATAIWLASKSDSNLYFTAGQLKGY